MLEKQVLSYTEHLVERGPYHIYAREYPGEEPAIVLMHGFPDNLHLYDRLLPFKRWTWTPSLSNSNLNTSCWSHTTLLAHQPLIGRWYMLIGSPRSCC